MVHSRWITPVGRLFFLAAALASAELSGCRASASHTTDTPVEPARLTDAAALPSFEDTDAQPPIERFYVELGDAPVRGPDAAPVTVVMFSDFECPYCREGYLTLRALEHRYHNAIRIAYKSFPLDFHSNALPAALAAKTAQHAGKFWEFHDQLFAGNNIEMPALLNYARQIGLDPTEIDRDLEGLQYGPEVNRDIRQARRLGVRSTPTFYINGRMLSGARPLDELAGIVDDELKRAQQWRAEGIPPSDIYQHAIEGGYRAVQYTEKRRRLDPDTVAVVPIGPSPVRGSSTAPVTVVIFGDFQCPFCARGNVVLESLRARYGDKLREVYKQNPLPFHSHAFVAARASLAAHAAGKFWEFHDRLYAMGGRFTEETLVEIARDVGLNPLRFREQIRSADFDRAIDDDLALAAALGVTGTPAYFVNGRAIEGALPELQFRLVIEEELQRARRALASGTEPRELYQILTHQPLSE